MTRAPLFFALCVICLYVSAGRAQTVDDPEVKASQLAKSRVDAEKAKLDSEIALARAKIDAIKVAGELARVGDEVSKLDADARNSQKAANLDGDLALVKKLKEIVGDPPKVGKDGAIALTESKSVVLLRTRRASLDAIKKAVPAICSRLTQASVQNAFVAPNDFSQKMQKSRYFVSQLAGVHDLATNVDKYVQGLVDDGPAPQSVATAVAALTAARYLIGGVDELSKAFRADYSISVDNTSRSGILEQMVSQRCGSALAIVDLEAALRLDKNQAYWAKIDVIARAIDLYDGVLASSAEALTREKTELTRLQGEVTKMQSEKKSVALDLAAESGKKVEEQNSLKISLQKRELSRINRDLNATVKRVADAGDRLAPMEVGAGKLKRVDPKVTRLRQWFESWKGKDAELLENLAWANFDLNPIISGADRAYFVVTSQDIQIEKDRIFVGKKMSGAATVEVIFRVVTPAGLTRVADAISISGSNSKYDLDEFIDEADIR